MFVLNYCARLQRFILRSETRPLCFCFSLLVVAEAQSLQHCSYFCKKKSPLSEKKISTFDDFPQSTLRNHTETAESDEFVAFYRLLYVGD